MKVGVVFWWFGCILLVDVVIGFRCVFIENKVEKFDDDGILNSYGNDLIIGLMICSKVFFIDDFD